jgi:hypothetical protein
MWRDILLAQSGLLNGGFNEGKMSDGCIFVAGYMGCGQVEGDSCDEQAGLKASPVFVWHLLQLAFAGMP